MILKDDRTPAQKQSPHIIVLATDSFMSGWGQAEQGPSYAGWACTSEQEYKVWNWVARRPEMKRVRVVMDNYRPPTGPGHCHIYVVDDNHPAIR